MYIVKDTISGKVAKNAICNSRFVFDNHDAAAKFASSLNLNNHASWKRTNFVAVKI